MLFFKLYWLMPNISRLLINKKKAHSVTIPLKRGGSRKVLLISTNVSMLKTEVMGIKIRSRTDLSWCWFCVCCPFNKWIRIYTMVKNIVLLKIIKSIIFWNCPDSARKWGEKRSVVLYTVNSHIPIMAAKTAEWNSAEYHLRWYWVSRKIKFMTKYMF